MNFQPYSINDFVFRDEKCLVLDPLEALSCIVEKQEGSSGQRTMNPSLAS